MVIPVHLKQATVGFRVQALRKRSRGLRFAETAVKLMSTLKTGLANAVYSRALPAFSIPAVSEI